MWETFLVGQISPEGTEALYVLGVLASLLVAIMNQANVEKPNLQSMTRRNGYDRSISKAR